MLGNVLDFFSKNKKKSQEILNLSRQKSKEIEIQAQREALKVKQEAQREARKIVDEALQVEKRAHARIQSLTAKERGLNKERERIDQLKREIERKREELSQKVAKVSSLNPEQAKKMVLSGWEKRLEKEIVERIKEAEAAIKTKVDQKAREMIVDAMRYGAVDYVSEYTVSTVTLPSDDFKGRIIGKDGRNVRAFELATGVDVDLEEDGIIKLSSFDAIRREIAKISLEKLIKDGRIQPQRIEEVVKKVKQDVKKTVYRAGEDLIHRVGVFNLPTEIIELLGRFKYRYSYGQNMILHTLEETKIGVALAHELKADVNVVKLGCLLHDIGKVINDKEGNHVGLAVQLLKQYRFPQAVIDCVASHHEDVPFKSVEAVIVYLADAVSGGRPGARHEDFQSYLKRIETIEGVIKEREGIKDVYALQAGRELRVVIQPEKYSDKAIAILAEEARKDLETKFKVFPGQIKITVIREVRAEAVTQI